MRIKILFFIGLICFMNSCTGQSSSVDKAVVKTLDLDKYLGTWYEISRFDHSFERDLVGVTATYSFREDGKIKVVNSGYKGSLDGEFSEAIGKAKVPDTNFPSKLKVAFFWIFYADYFVLELDEGYKWAVIGSSSDDYLWILSRTPQITDELYADLLQRLTKRGYDVSKLIKVEQKQE